ncbi:MAG: helix-turn-helix domain-containing protein [Curvibacter sp.]|jgi:transcriptional regulator of acetoin/glycerol metabolism|nr:histidine kinase [Curvibacter sp.]
MRSAPAVSSTSRLARIGRARQLSIHEGSALADGLVEPWIAQSWQRCLAQGLRPDQRVHFDAVSPAMMRQAAEGNRNLVMAARPILRQLGQVLAETRYFAILTNEAGVVIDTEGPIDRSDRRAALITRVGVDLSEASVGTTAIGAALRELQPVWLHRGEHFFNDTSAYSCAGAPLFGPDGHCVGMLDLTGVEAAERPELRHLAMHAARRIENALLLLRPHRLLLRLAWPGLPPGDEADGIVTLDADGCVRAANRAARQLLPMLDTQGMELHARDLFALPLEMLFDTAWRSQTLDVPLWSGLRLQVRAELAGRPHAASTRAPAPTLPLRDVETRLIRKAVEDARGNVAQAARNLGISRATVYRKLGK